jgi:hypothetical protein
MAIVAREGEFSLLRERSQARRREVFFPLLALTVSLCGGREQTLTVLVAASQMDPAVFLEMETLSCMQLYPELYDVLALEDMGAKRPRSEEEAVAHTIATDMLSAFLPEQEATVSAAPEPAEKKRRGGGGTPSAAAAARKGKKTGRTKDERKEFLERRVGELVAHNGELLGEMRVLERETLVLQEQLVQLHQAQARVRMARKLEASALPHAVAQFTPTIVSRSELA